MQKFFVTIVLSILFVGSLARSIDVLSKNLEEQVSVDFVDDEENVQLTRQKRQFGFGPQNYGQSSALANANAFNQYSGPGGFGGSAANAGAQAFRSQGPLGGFGASAANSQTQGFSAGPGGIQGSAGLSGSQTYDLPNGHHINLAYGGSFSQNNGQGSGSNSNSLTYT